MHMICNGNCPKVAVALITLPKDLYHNTSTRTKYCEVPRNKRLKKENKVEEMKIRSYIVL